MFLNTGPCNAILVNVVPPAMRSTAFAISIFLIHVLGDIWSPIVIGALADATGNLTTGMLLTVFAIGGAGVAFSARHALSGTGSARSPALGAGHIASPRRTSVGAAGHPYLIAPTVKPVINRSRKKLYRMAIGTLAMKQAAISEPQK